MLFTFKRDDEGRERIYVGGVCVAKMIPNSEFDVLDHRFDRESVNEAIERADEAGFWSKGLPYPKALYLRNEVTVDVPVADNAVPSVTTGEDQS